MYELLSLDGVAERPDSFFTEWDDAMDANLAAVIGTQDAVILGRRIYDEWAEYWPPSETEPFATFINGVAKYVATSSPLNREWANSTVIEGGLVEFVQDLKDRPGGDIGVHAQYLGRPGTACRGRRRRAEARDRADDRRQRTKTPRRAAADSARVDPKRDFAGRISARRLPRHPLGEDELRGTSREGNISPAYRKPDTC